MKRSFGYYVLAVVFCAVALPFGAAQAADYPDRPIHWVVPYPPGGTTDVIARNVAQIVSQSLGESIVVDNRAGAGGQIAMNAVAKAAPDGYTLLVSDASVATAPSLYKKLSFDPAKDLTAVSLFVTVPHIVVVNPTVPAKSLIELIALSKKNTGKLNFGSGGIGSPLHLAGEALRAETGISWTHVPYRGSGPTLIGTMSNEVQIATPSLPAVLPLVTSGKLRALAVMSPKRLPSLPDVPTVAELGFPKATVEGWVGLHAPAGTPSAIIEKLAAAADKALKDPELQKRLEKLGADVANKSSGAYGAMIVEEAARWKRVVRAAGIKPQ